MAATGASGTTSVRYGTMRENVLSLTVVTADGEIVRTRSRARKSSAGYDLTRLFVGSEGTLGLITEITLRLQPTPEAMTAATAAFPSLDAAIDTVIEVLAHAIPIARMEIADDVQIDAVNRHFDLDLEVAPTLFLEFHGTPAETKAQAEETKEIAEAHGVHGFAWAPDEAERRALWHARHGAYEAGRALRPGSQGFTTDACVPISRLAETIAETKRDLDASGLIAPIVGHVGDGNFHLAILVDPDDPDELQRAIDAQRPLGEARHRRRRNLHRRARRRLWKISVSGARAWPRRDQNDARGQVGIGSERPLQSGKGRRLDSGVIQLGLGPHRGHREESVTTCAWPSPARSWKSSTSPTNSPGLTLPESGAPSTSASSTISGRATGS